MKNVVWGYSTEEQPDLWEGAFPTREKAIADAFAAYPDEAEAIWICRGKRPDPTFYFDVDDILERAQEMAYDEAGEAAEGWLDVSDEAKAKLERVIQAWVRKFAPVHFWVSDDKPELVRPSK